MKQLSDSESNARIRNALRMSLNTFNALNDWLVDNAELKSSRVTDSAEKSAIFFIRNWPWIS